MNRNALWPTEGPLGLDGARAWLLDPDARPIIIGHLERYYSDEDPNDAFTGRLFEVFCARSAPRDRFGPYDVLAAETLGVSIPSDVVDWLLQPESHRDELLSKCVELVDQTEAVGLWSCDETWLLDTSPFVQLYETLRIPGLGPTKRSKLLATKLPSIVPIRDSLVAELLVLTSSQSWWGPIRSLMIGGTSPVWRVLEHLPLPSSAPEVSLLRRLDVVLWMEARSRSLGR